MVEQMLKRIKPEDRESEIPNIQKVAAVKSSCILKCEYCSAISMNPRARRSKMRHEARHHEEKLKCVVEGRPEGNKLGSELDRKNVASGQINVKPGIKEPQKRSDVLKEGKAQP